MATRRQMVRSRRASDADCAHPLRLVLMYRPKHARRFGLFCREVRFLPVDAASTVVAGAAVVLRELIVPRELVVLRELIVPVDAGQTWRRRRLKRATGCG